MLELVNREALGGDAGESLWPSAPESTLGFQDIIKKTNNYMVSCSVIPNEKLIRLILHKSASIIK